MSKKQKKILLRIVIAAALTVFIILLPLSEKANFVLSLATYLIIGYDILRKAFFGIINRRLFDESFLMSVATIGAFALAIYSKSGDYLEGIAVMLFYQIGELFQSYAVGKSRKSIKSLIDVCPEYANVEIDGRIEKVDPSEVKVGEIIVVGVGERLPIDGEIVFGETSLDQSALTGESIPVDKRIGDIVSSGAINLRALIKIRTTKPFEDSTVSKILALVEDATHRKAKSEQFISKFARYYTPIVCISALVLAVLPPLTAYLMGNSLNFAPWIYRALSFLVISCPCALVISVPLSFFSGIGGAGREGILIKGSNYLEALSKVKTVVFDKTGTLTEGQFEVNEIVADELDKEKLLEYAAIAEAASSHPIAKSICRAYGKEIDIKRISDLEEIGGNGVVATIDGKKIAVGNEKLMETCNVRYLPPQREGTIIYTAIDGIFVGYFVISDKIKDDALQSIRELHSSGVSNTVMLTGDAESVARLVCERLQINSYHAELLPYEKVDVFEKLLSEKKKNTTVAFVGDGINDAPVITRADVGIAMGGIGSDAAIEAADVVLTDDNPRKIARAIKISKKCMKIVYENIFFALGVKGLCLILGVFGVVNMPLAIFADVGVMVLAVVNSVRAMKVS